MDRSLDGPIESGEAEDSQEVLWGLAASGFHTELMLSAEA